MLGLVSWACLTVVAVFAFIGAAHAPDIILAHGAAAVGPLLQATHTVADRVPGRQRSS